VAEVGTDGAPNALYHVIFDGTFVEPKGFLAMGGEAEALNADLQRSYRDGLTLGEAVRLAVRTLRRGSPQGEASTRLEVAVLERHRPRRSFRRLTDDQVTAAVGGGAGDGARATGGVDGGQPSGSNGAPPAGDSA
jgi:proteasome alpha subunit